jgi:hypothetical protein
MQILSTVVEGFSGRRKGKRTVVVPDITIEWEGKQAII